MPTELRPLLKCEADPKARSAGNNHRYCDTWTRHRYVGQREDHASAGPRLSLTAFVFRCEACQNERVWGGA